MRSRLLRSRVDLALLAVPLTLTASWRGDIKPCELLTPAQVSTVLPKADKGFVAANGESLIPGVKSYQCSYVNPETHLLTVVVTVAADDASFAKIAPSASSHEDHRKVAVGDGGWVFGDPNDLKVEAVKGRTLIDLHVMAPGAQQKADQLVELARAVAKKV
jgi:hypothetical protein